MRMKKPPGKAAGNYSPSLPTRESSDSCTSLADRLPKESANTGFLLRWLPALCGTCGALKPCAMR